MKAAGRWAALAGIGALLVGGWVWIATPPDEARGETGGARGNRGAAEPARRWQSSHECRSCHEKVYREWSGSHHQIAYTNPEVRKLSNDFRIKDCQACHLPRPVAQTGYGKRSLPRQTRPLEGVGCLSCHLGADGRILARHDNPKAPCKPRADAAFPSADMCSSCHNQHQTTDQWRASRWPKEGKSCIDCHMGDAGHVFPGAHDAGMLRAAGDLKVEARDGKLHLALHNKGAGHNFPTEERHRAVDIEYRFVSGDSVPETWTRVFRFRQPYRDEPGENTQLPAHAAKTFEVEIPTAATRVQVQMWYRLNPFAKNGDAASTLLDEREVAVR